MESSDYQNTDARIEIEIFPVESSSISVKPSINTLMEAIKTVVTAEKEFDYPKESILLVSFGISDRQDSFPRIKKSAFSMEPTSKIVKVSIENLMKKLNPQLGKIMTRNVQINQFY